MKGNLKVNVISANLMKDTDLIGKMDPYFEIQVGSQKNKSQVSKDQGTKPVWNQEFAFKVDGESEIKITLFDDDIGKDDFIGQTTLAIAQFANGIPFDSNFTIYTKDMKAMAGQLRVKVAFESVIKPTVVTPSQNTGSWGK